MATTLFPFKANLDVTAPPSKSYAHRLMIAAALGEGEVEILNVGLSDDVKATAECLKNLGAGVSFEGENVKIKGIFGEKKGTKSAVLDCGESGSTLRFLFPIASALGIDAEFTGRGNLLNRPNTVLTEALKKHGVKVDGFSVSGKLESGVYEIDATVSSQYITGLLFALPLLNGDSKIILSGELVSSDYIDITLEILKLAGIRVDISGGEFTVYGGQHYRLPSKVTCEGDWSGAAFLFVLGAISGAASVSGLKLDSRQGDKRILDFLALSGAEIEISTDKITVKKSELKGFNAYLENCPDLAPIVCVLAAAAKGKSEITGLKRLRIKESDRLSAIADMLGAAGIRCEATGDAITIYGGEVSGADFNGYKDHRIVMAATVLSSIANGKSTVTDENAVNKSYTNFFRDIKGEKNA